MPRISEVNYSHEATIEAIRDCFNCLTKMDVSESYLQGPPKEGWPNITKANFARLGKTDEVIELLPHIPYIWETCGDDRTEIVPECHVADYNSTRWLTRWLDNIQTGGIEGLKVTTEADACETSPAHVVGLCSGGRDSTHFLLDTKLGVVYWISCTKVAEDHPCREQITDNIWDYLSPEEQDKRYYPAWVVVDFFEVLKDQFRTLQFVPYSRYTLMDTGTGYDSDGKATLAMLQGIFWEHGWPDLEVYNKKKCLKAVKKELKENPSDYLLIDSSKDEDEEEDLEENLPKLSIHDNKEVDGAE
jgi:hypothetical protein